MYMCLYNSYCFHLPWPADIGSWFSHQPFVLGSTDMVFFDENVSFDVARNPSWAYCHLLSPMGNLRWVTWIGFPSKGLIWVCSTLKRLLTQ